MSGLFSGQYSTLTKFIFDLYDFDRDGIITPADIRLVLSYIPLNTNKFNENYEDRLQAQSEIQMILDHITQSFTQLEFSDFVHTVENITSDIFIYVKLSNFSS
jgi:Ca2+-binding EF-hand superfamily protein